MRQIGLKNNFQNTSQHIIFFLKINFQHKHIVRRVIRFSFYFTLYRNLEFIDSTMTKQVSLLF